MKRNGFLTLVLLTLVATPLFAQQPARSTTLPNGLDLVMQPDRTTPLLSSLLIVRAGSGNETMATAGATHLLEHMIFRGTESRSQDEIYDAFDRMGAYYNAQTSKTYTNFILVTPVEHASEAMDIQADMILRSVIDADTMEVEKGRVLNELRQGEERSSTRADAHHLRNVYAPTSYGFPTVGTVKGIEAIPAERVKQFHDVWYAVNNMTLVLRGDLSYAEMEQLARETYGSLTPRDLPDRTAAWPTGLEDWRRNQVFTEYGADGAGSLRMTVAAPRHDDPGALAFSALTLLLGERLEQRLQGGRPLVTYVYSGVEYDPDFAVLNITAGLMPGSDPETVADSMLAALRSLSPESITRQQVREAIRDQRRSELFFAEQVQYGSFLLVPKLAVAPWGFWDRFETAQDSLAVNDLADAYHYWFAEPSFVATAYLPQEDTDQNGGGVELGEVKVDTLANGLVVAAREVRGAPVAGIHVAAKHRSAWEGDDKRGWVDLLHRLLLEQPEGQPSLDDRMSEIGLEVDVVDDPRVPMDNYRTVPEYSFIRVQAEADAWPEALEFIGDRLAASDFGESEVETVISDQRSVVSRSRTSLRSQASARFDSLLFGPNIQSAPIYGDTAAWAAASPEALRTLRRDVFGAENLLVSVLSPAPANQVLDVAGRAFGDLPRGDRSVPEVAPPRSTPGVDTVSASGRQGYLATGFLIKDVPPDEQAALLVANAILSDRIYRDLGEKRGWAYGAGSSVLLRGDWSAWTCRVALPAEHLDEARDIVRQLREDIVSGDFEADRVEIARNDLRGSTLRRYSSRINLAMAMGADLILHGQPDHTWRLYDRIGEVSVEEVERAAREYLDVEKGQVTVYGIPEAGGEMGRPPMGMGMGH